MGPSVVPILIPLLDDEWDEMRMAAAVILGRLGAGARWLGSRPRAAVGSAPKVIVSACAALRDATFPKLVEGQAVVGLVGQKAERRAPDPQTERAAIVGQQPDGADAFVHYSDIVSQESYKTLIEGESVEYDVQDGERGPKAVKVVRLVEPQDGQQATA